MTNLVPEESLGSLFGSAPGRWWNASVTWETHGLLWNNTSAGARKLFNFLYASAGVSLTPHDEVKLRGGIYQFLIADEGESGIRSTDLTLAYSHTFALPAQLSLRASAAVTAPISFYSQKASLITAPTVTASLSRSYKGLSAELQVFGGLYFTRYTTTEGGAPNPRGVAGVSLDAEYAAWFHKALVVGVDAYTGYLWYQNVGTPPVGQYFGAVQDQQFTAQPVQQLYGGEIFVRYSAPTFHGVHADLTLALADGDSTLGYASLNIDGVSRVFVNLFSVFEVYGALSVRY
jgi:hypothetical protein